MSGRYGWLLLLWMSGGALADSLTLGVFAYRPPAVMVERYQPLADYLSSQLSGREVVLRALTLDEMELELSRQGLDLVFTNPVHYQLIRSRNTLSGALVTLVNQHHGVAVSSLGGVIFTRADQPSIQRLEDLRGRVVAVPGRRFLGGYQAQHFELLEAGINLPQVATVVEVGSHDATVQAVLEGRAEVGFVRSGVLEALQQEGQLEPGALRVLHVQSLGSYPYAVSTRLYPEWPVVALPHLDAAVVRQVAAALLLLEPGHPVAQAAGIAGFMPPADYLPVEQLSRRLRLPPFDQQPEITWFDIWQQHQAGIVVSLLLLLVSGLLSLLLLLHNRRLRESSRALRASEALYQSLVDSLPMSVYRVDREGALTFANRTLLKQLGVSLEQVQGKRACDFYPLEDAEKYRQDDQQVIASGQVLHLVEEQRDPQSGERLHVEVVKIPIDDASGKVCGVQGVFWDVSERVRGEQALAESRKKLLYAQYIAGLGDFTWEVASNRVHWSEGMCRLLGYPADAVLDLQQINADVHYPEDVKWVNRWLRESLHSGEEVLHPQEYRLVRRDGEVIWVQTSGRIEYREGQAVRLFGVCQEITARRQAEQQLRLAADVFTHAKEGIIITDAQGTILRVNAAFTQITGYPGEEVVGKNPRILKSGRQDAAFYTALWRDLVQKGQWGGEIWNRRKDGTLYPGLMTISGVRDVAGIIQHYVCLFSDISTQKRHQQQLEHIAHHDALTHLPNRLLLADRLRQGIAHARRRQQRLAVAYIDLDGFKEINDQYGHAVGDQLLIALAERFRMALREGDTVARLGGDEFVAVLLDLPEQAAAGLLCERLLLAAEETLFIGGMGLSVSASIGVTLYPQSEECDADQLLRQADQAMYQAKLSGKGRFHWFDAEKDRAVRGQQQSLERVAQALCAGEFQLYYQPKVNMRSGRLVGVEALLRWQHPEHGLLVPAQFLPAVLDSPLILELGEWVLASAVAQLERWHQQGLPIALSVNVAARQLQQQNFVEHLRTLLAAHPGVASRFLELEILESSALEDIAQTSRVMRECGELGVRFALDDFGTGYSSLTYLKRLPTATLKIDYSFVRDMLNDPEDLAILNGILGLAKTFRREVVAEGVESPEQGELLLQLGCELGQGYGIAPPMEAHAVASWHLWWRPDPRWIGLPPLPREEQPLLFAAVEHRAWVRQVSGYLHGAQLVPPPLDQEQCRFGHWLHGDAAGRYGKLPGYAQVVERHQQIHQLATELIEWRNNGRLREALESLERLYILRDELLGDLRKLIGEG